MQIKIIIKNYRCFPDEKPLHLNLAKGFTALLGANNSGKSSILKFFHEFRSIFKLLSEPTGNLLSSIRGNFQALGLGPSVSDSNEVFSNINERDLIFELLFKAIDPTRYPERFVVKVRRSSQPSFTSELNDASGSVVLDPDSNFKKSILLAGKKRIDFSPIFQTFKELSQAIFIPSFRNAINAGATSGYFDIDVGQKFIENWRTYKTGSIKKHNEAAYKVTEDIKTIFGFKDLEINPSNDTQTLQMFIDGKSYRLSEIGSGLAQFILTFANAAIKEPSYILIDEPELNLHPSLQLDFLTSLTSYAKQGIIFATHSIGLARSCADQIYSFKQLGEGISEVSEFEATPRLSEFLGELSFTGYKELGFDRILLVEGVTDVKTIQQLLRKHKKDHEIVLLPLGGSQMINKTREQELQEIKRISDKVSALIDSERKTAEASLSSARKGFQEVCKKDGIDCHVLKRRAIENYFSDRAVKRVKGSKYSALEPYQNLTDANLSWSKPENWRIAREMDLAELESTDLGKFLNRLCKI